MKTARLFLIFLAVLILSANAFGATVSMPDMTGDAGATVDIPVDVDNSTGIISYWFNVTYDPVVLDCSTVMKGSLTNGTGSNTWDAPTVNDLTGEIRLLSMVSDTATPLSGVPGSLALIHCTVVGSSGASTSLHFTHQEVLDSNMNAIAITLIDGSFTINGGCIPSTEVCDGVDNDCDGQVDEGITPVPTTCGIGACAATGESTCQSGQMVDSCTPGTPQTEGPFGNATCSDQTDNDCDGKTDAADTGCAQQCTPSTEVCDGLDNDCDGSIDEDIAAVRITCGTGICKRGGLKTCVNGSLVDSCTLGTPQTEGPAGNATCSDQIDNDCDGLTDSADQDCGAQCIPSTEVCDGIDNDCDGSIDENIAAIPTTCGIGACAKTGQKTCQGGQMVDSCTPGTPSTEVCDGVDNDCDGQVDEGLTRSTTCGIGACAATGTETCTAGGWGGNTCTPGTPGTEGPFGNATCSDQIDNDCDGKTDAADTGCVQQCTPSTEVCDGLDNDCDGSIDENIAAIPTTCGIGACAKTGQKTCQGGQMVDSCTPGTPQTEGPFGNATCSDQTDNDCDGTTDAADTDCVKQCSPSAEVCDGADNDCDGEIDENITPVPTTCGIGACAATGESTCQGGQMVDSCTPGTSSTEVCDGVDNDCDGQVDEDIAAIPTTCGIGACAATGESTCQGGQMVDSCTPGMPQTEGPAGNATCSDQIDNDCDGKTDAADSSCQDTRSGMGQWVGTWFSVKGTLKGSTFNTPDSKFLADKDGGNGYIHIWSWDPDTKELHYDYYEYLKNEGKWESYTEKLHFLAGTDLKFLFTYNNTSENIVSVFSGVIEGKVQKGILKSATIKSLGGYYTEVYNDNTMYSTGLQTLTGKMIDAAKVAVPANVISAH